MNQSYLKNQLIDAVTITNASPIQDLLHAPTYRVTVDITFPAELLDAVQTDVTESGFHQLFGEVISKKIREFHS